MAIEFKKTTHSGHVPEIWRGEAKILPAGFKPANTLEVGMVLHRGTPVFVEFENRTCAVCKAAKVLAGGTTSKPRIAKGHLFSVGDVVAKVGKNDASRTISSIDTSNEAYDVLNLNSAITGLAENDVIVESVAYGYIDAESGDAGALKIVASNPSDGEIALASVTPYLGTKTLAANDYVILQNSGNKYEPNAVVGSVLEVNGRGIPTIDVAYDAVVLTPSLATPILADWLNGFCLKSNPNILFIKQ